MNISSENKTVAVIIPCYNYAKYLGECIDSLLRQSRVPDEIIVVDDESPDNTKEVCEKYAHAGVKYIWQKNKGLSGSRNTGIKAAKSQYVMCLDADDMLKPDAIKEHLALVDENSIAQCGLMEFGATVGTFRPMGASIEILRKTNTVYCNAMYPKSMWEKIGGYDESETMRLGWEDYEFWIRALKAGYKVNTSNYIALLYRRHASTMTKSTTHPNLPKIKAYMKGKHPDLWP